ncbi:MAG: hypothetical protein U0269_19695 [Polyangiales bacterium]
MEIENLTDVLQRHLGIQQAQSVALENVTADSIARLTATRGDVRRLVQLWEDPESVVVGLSDTPALREPILRFRAAIEDGFVTRRKGNSSVPVAFVPFAPRMVTRTDERTVFRGAGASVLEGLWRDESVREGVRNVVVAWEAGHPVASLLAPLCEPHSIANSRPQSNLRDVIDNDPELAEWVDGTVREDWLAWIAAAKPLSIDEQFESMTALIGLHLHIALLRRLCPRDATSRPLVFMSAHRGQHLHNCDRSARDVFDWWSDRARAALLDRAANVIDQVIASDDKERESLHGDWSALGRWSTHSIAGSKPTTARWRTAVLAEIEQRKLASIEHSPAAARALLVDVLVKTFLHGTSHVVSKIRDFLRYTGVAAGIIGPTGRFARKRYLLDDRALDLLVRLHVQRPEESVRSSVEEKGSVAAMLDDVFDRYGLAVDGQSDAVRAAISKAESHDQLRVLRKQLPSDRAMEENRVALESRLDELRLVRRYSDASATLNVR